MDKNHKDPGVFVAQAYLNTSNRTPQKLYPLANLVLHVFLEWPQIVPKTCKAGIVVNSDKAHPLQYLIMSILHCPKVNEILAKSIQKLEKSCAYNEF